MKIFILILLTALLAACAVVPLAPPSFYDGPGMGDGPPAGTFCSGPYAPSRLHLGTVSLVDTTDNGNGERKGHSLN